MTFEDVLKLTRQRIGAIAVGLVIGIALSLVGLWLTPITYTASAVAYVRVSVPSDSEDQSRADSYYAASQLASQKVKAFVPVFTSEPVAQGVINTLGLATTPAELSGSITATSEKNALTINVSAVAPTAAEAQAVADETVRQADAQIRRLEGSRSPVGLVLMSPSSMSGATRSPSLPRHLGLGGLGGVVLGYLLAFTRNALDKRVRSQSDVASVVEEPVLAAIPRSASIARDERSEDHDHRAEEALRKLRTNLRYANIDKGLRTLIVSSALQGDGKSTVSANLARVMALSGQDVILMEGDLRRPTMKDTFRMGSHHPGLSQLLVGATSLERALVRTPVAGLQVIPAGDTPPNPSELLGSTRMSELLSYLAADHVVIIDAPPILPVTDAVALAEHADGVLLVVRSGSTTQDQLRQAAAGIKQGGGAVLGVVLNQVPSSGFDRLRYGEDLYGYAATDYAPSSPSPKPPKGPRESVPRIMQEAVPDTRGPADSANRTPGAESDDGAGSAPSTMDFIAMLERQRPTASRWTPAQAQTWRTRPGHGAANAAEAR